MSAANKTRLEVQKIIRDNIILGLSCLGYTVKDATHPSGFDVMEYGNPSFQSADTVVLMNFLRSERVGWQSTKYRQRTLGLQRIVELIDQQHWQLHIICKRKNDVPLAEDVGSDLVTWFNGMGCEELRKKGCASLRIDGDNVIVYNDNSDLYQKRVVFTVKIQVPKELTFGQANLSALEVEDYPV